MLKEELEDLELPDILKSNTGSYVKNIQEWEKRREEIKEILCQEEYGYLIKNKHVLITTKLIKILQTAEKGLQAENLNSPGC